MNAYPSYPTQTSAPWEYPQEQRGGTNGFAVTSLIFGIVGGILLAVPFGIAGLRRARNTGTGRGMSIAGLILSGVWAVLLLALVAVGALASGGTSSLDVKVGDCVKELPTGTRVMTMRVVPCDQPHLAEVYAVLEMSSGGFPGGAAVDAFTDKCDPALRSYAPQAYADDSVGIYTLHPTRTSWTLGDRVVTCIATSENPQTGSILEATGRPSIEDETAGGTSIDV
jgi:hypothetical protein